MERERVREEKSKPSKLGVQDNSALASTSIEWGRESSCTVESFATFTRPLVGMLNTKKE